MYIPPIDLPGVKRRSQVRPSYYDDVEAQTPGFTAQSIRSNIAAMYARLRKRYAKGIPWGTVPPPLTSIGTTPPQLTLTGTPTLGSLLILIEVLVGGAVGTATFKFSTDGGTTFSAPVTTAPTNPLAGTGMALVIPTGSVFDVSNVYSAPPPVPDAILKWLVCFVQIDVLERHGVNPADPLMTRQVTRAEKADKDLEEAANTNTGLFELPVNDDSPTAVSSGGPMAYSEASPYSWSYLQQARAQRETVGLPVVVNKLVGG